jgi:hypothetical protein
MNDAQRYRTKAAECLSAAERSKPPYRSLTLTMAASWLLLERQERTVDLLRMAAKPEARPDETSQRRGNMQFASTLSVTLLAGLTLAMWTSHASAQSPGWAAAAAKCRAQVRAQYPTARESEGMRSARARGYNACLFGLGYRP